MSAPFATDSTTPLIVLRVLDAGPRSWPLSAVIGSETMMLRHLRGFAEVVETLACGHTWDNRYHANIGWSGVNAHGYTPAHSRHCFDCALERAQA